MKWYEKGAEQGHAEAQIVLNEREAEALCNVEPGAANGHCGPPQEAPVDIDTRKTMTGVKHMDPSGRSFLRRTASIS